MTLSLLLLLLFDDDNESRRQQDSRRVRMVESFGRGSCSHNLKKTEVGKKRGRERK